MDIADEFTAKVVDRVKKLRQGVDGEFDVEVPPAALEAALERAVALCAPTGRAATMPPAAIASVIATVPAKGVSAEAPTSSPRIFGASFSPRAKPTRLALQMCALLARLPAETPPSSARTWRTAPIAGTTWRGVGASMRCWPRRPRPSWTTATPTRPALKGACAPSATMPE